MLPFADRLRRPFGAALVVTLSTALAIPSWAADAYLLSISDRLTIKVVQWKPAESIFEEWSALGGDYIVGADGNLNFPVIGNTPVAGLTSAELSAALGANLQQTLGLTTAPTVSVEVSEYGPIYVSGDVGSPGEYPFAPNLTVVKALALAGGERRGSETSSRPEKEILTTAGALDVLVEEHRRQLVRRARLDAQLAAQPEIMLPAELTDVPGVEAVLAAEQAIMDAQKRQADVQVQSLDDQIALLERQITAFEQKRTGTETQLGVAREQLANITSLSDDGLALSSRVATVQTNVSDLESRILDTETATLQAQQDIAQAQREKARLEDQRLADLSLERQTVDSDIASLALRIETQRGLVQEAALYTGATVPGMNQPSYSYSIIRNGEELPAELSTAVQAGDVIMARLALATTPTPPQSE